MTFPSPLIDIAMLGALAAIFAQSMGRRLPIGPATLMGGIAIIAVLGIALSMMGGWHSDLTTALRVSILATLALAGICFRWIWRDCGGVFVILSPYACLVIALAWLISLGNIQDHVIAPHGPWFAVHIVVAVGAYAAITMAAIAAMAVTFGSRALKRRSGLNAFEAALPPILVAEAVQNRFLVIGGGVLGAGVLSGVALNAVEGEALIELSHKSFLTIGAFLSILSLLVAQHLFSVRGKSAARAVLLAYLLVTLGYPGVKFVTDLLVSPG